jgi:hypothetical protein
MSGEWVHFRNTMFPMHGKDGRPSFLELGRDSKGLLENVRYSYATVRTRCFFYPTISFCRLLFPPTRLFALEADLVLSFFSRGWEVGWVGVKV